MQIMSLFYRVLKRLSHNKVTVLAFHKVPRFSDVIAPAEPSLAEFEAILQFVTEKFTVISLQDAFRGLSMGTLSAGAVCLTFDDGYVDWLDTVAPFLSQNNIPATFFVTTGQLDGTPLWHERVRLAIREMNNNSCLDITDPNLTRRIGLVSIGDRIQAARYFERYLKTKIVSERDLLITRLEYESKASSTLLPRINEVQIRDLHNLGFEIGAHSVNHPILSKTTIQAARDEIGDSKDRLEAIIGSKVRFFAYPNGRRTDFYPVHAELARECGYQGAFTTEGGAWVSSSDLFQIPRFTPWGPGAGRMTWQLARNLF